MRISSENLRLPILTNQKTETPVKVSTVQSPTVPRRRSYAPSSPNPSNKDRYSLGSESPMQETPSPRRSPQLSPGFKTFHAPKANQVYVVPEIRTYDPNRIDALIVTLGEKLVSMIMKFNLIQKSKYKVTQGVKI